MTYTGGKQTSWSTDDGSLRPASHALIASLVSGGRLVVTTRE